MVYGLVFLLTLASLFILVFLSLGIPCLIIRVIRAAFLLALKILPWLAGSRHALLCRLCLPLLSEEVELKLELAGFLRYSKQDIPMTFYRCPGAALEGCADRGSGKLVTASANDILLSC